MTYAPRVGETVRDTGLDRVGMVMGDDGPYVQLRPLGGGRESDAAPERLRRLTREELVSARLAAVNNRSRASGR